MQLDNYAEEKEQCILVLMIQLHTTSALYI